MITKASSSSSSVHPSVDDSHFSALFHQQPGGIPPASDAQYAEELQIQEAIIASFDAQTASSTGEASPLNLPPPETIEGERQAMVCGICVEEGGVLFRIDRCPHAFCTGCISRYVAVRVADGRAVVACPVPGCGGAIEIEACRAFLPAETVSSWEKRLCESTIEASQRFYCPFKDCSAMMVNEGGEAIGEAECPVCHRLFCAVCRSTWHPGIGCEEYQRLSEDERGREDLIARELAVQKKWKRCPRCNYYVEKTGGCIHMTCRCGSQFCYSCGATWTSTHGDCQN